MRNNYEIIDNYAIIYLNDRKNNRYEMKIDIKYLDDLLNLDSTWYPFLDHHNKLYYGRTTIYMGTVDNHPKYNLFFIHQYLFDRKKEKILTIDHINHDTLDNREENIRLISGKNNTRNRKGRNSNNKSGYRNVCMIDNHWRIQLQINGKNYRFPEKFVDIDEAGSFAESMRRKYYGEFAGKG